MILTKKSIEKITKIIALIGSPNENESKSAIIHANIVLRKYGISLEEFKKQYVEKRQTNHTPTPNQKNASESPAHNRFDEIQKQAILSMLSAQFQETRMRMSKNYHSIKSLESTISLMEIAIENYRKQVLKKKKINRRLKKSLTNIQKQLRDLLQAKS